MTHEDYRLPDDMVESVSVGVAPGHAKHIGRPDFIPLVVQTSQPCQVHNRHVPASHVNEVHHVWPLGHDGPDIPENRIVVCATGHNSIHDLLAKLLAANGDVPASEQRGYSRGERRYALLGYQRITRGAM